MISKNAETEARRVFELQTAKRWEVAARPAAARIATLRKLRAAIVERRDALAAAVHADFRKNAAEFELTEIFPVLEEIDFVIDHLADWMEPRRARTPVVMLGTRSTVRHEALGVVLIISPWNYPFNLLFMPLVAALAAGNCVVLKPSQKTSHVAQASLELIQATFSEDEVAILTGGHEVSDALLELPFDHVLFTGSTSIGKKIMASAAKHLATVTLELGGKSAVIVDRTADIEAAATRVLWGKCLNSGQTCISPDYVLAHREVADKFVSAARGVIERFYGATPEAREASTDFARMIDDAAWRRVTGLVERSVAMGAEVAVGGRSNAAERYIEPTVLTKVTREMPIMREEIFGPVLPVLSVDSVEQASAYVRAGDKPLALYLFTRDQSAADHVLTHTTSGGAVVNDVFMHVVNPNLPFGGVGASGQGAYHGVHGFETFSHARSVVDRGAASSIPLFYPPYEGRRGDIAQRVLRALT